MAYLHPWGLTRLRLRPAGCSCVAVYLPAVGCGYGQEAILLESGERLVPYLFKLRHTAKVKALVQRMMREGALWQDCGDGWQALESSLRLSGWSRERRVIRAREAPSRAPVAEAELVIGIDPADLAHPPNQRGNRTDPDHHGAMERGAALDPPADPSVAPLAGRKVAPRPAAGSRSPAQ